MLKFPDVCSCGATVFAGLLFLALNANTVSAVSLGVEIACSLDYYAYCSAYDPDGPEVRKCMRANGLKLSKICVNGLIAEGEISQAEVDAIAKAAGKK